MKIIVLGGDGFCGWPSALHLAHDGHTVTIVDNLSRRAIADKISSPSLTPIRSIEERVAAAKKIGDVSFEYCDIAADPGRFKEILAEVNADVVVHFAEQRSAPYSMLGDAERKYTIDNNVTGTNNLMSILVELGQRPHILHLGTMGVYGYHDDFAAIPVCYVDVTVKSKQQDVSLHSPVTPPTSFHLPQLLSPPLIPCYL